MSELSEKLLAWYDVHRRTLPWRGIRDPYKIWLSEIMLQQTRTETVASYYIRFLERFPDVHSLASAAEDEVLKLWEGLGYYSRARNLHAAAKTVSANGGAFPSDAKGLRALRGIGPYAANAIASIAFDEPVPALDGNQARVLSRVLAHDAPLNTPFDLESQALDLIDSQRPGDYNQALMDLGAAVCTPKSPRCGECPIAALCIAHSEGDPESYPRKKPPTLKKEVELTVALVRCGGGLCLRKRPERGLLGGLYEFILLEGHPAHSEIASALSEAGFARPVVVSDLPPSKHVFTHLVWRMRGILVNADAAPDGVIVAHDLAPYAFPTALRVYRAAAEGIL